MTGFESAPRGKEKARERAKDKPAEKLKENPEDRLEKSKEKEKAGTMAAIAELASDVRDGVVDGYHDRLASLKEGIDAIREERVKDNPELADKNPSWWRTTLDAFAVGFGWLNNKVADVFEWFFGKKEKKLEKEEGEKKRKLEVDVDDDYEVTPQILRAGEKALRETLDKNPKWLGYAKEASKKFGVPVSTIFSVIYFESSFNPYAENDDGSCVGLGQFWVKTWPDFCANVSGFSDAERTDPRASIFGVAWYASMHAKSFKFDVKDPKAASLVYIGHHEGSGAATVYFSGGAKRVPKLYRNKTKMGVQIGGADDYENYRKALTRMSAKVGAMAVHYDKVLKEMESLNS